MTIPYNELNLLRIVDVKTFIVVYPILNDVLKDSDLGSLVQPLVHISSEVSVYWWSHDTYVPIS